MAIYELQTPFNYAKGGDEVAANFIELSGPTYKQMQWVSAIKQVVMNAFLEITERTTEAVKEENKEEPVTQDGSDMLKALYGSNQDLNKLFVNCQELFRNGAALVDGETKLTVPLMEKMSMEDFEGLVGCYLANFTLPSLVGGQNKSTNLK